MTPAPPHWYPDPTGRHQLRYWDGTQWTVHVASAGVVGFDPMLTVPGGSSAGAGAGSTGGRRGVRHLGWVGALLCVLALVAVAVPGVGFARTTAGDGVRLDGTAQHLRLPAHKTYGIYIDDADNSGYSDSCSAVDRDGRSIDIKDASWSVSSSDTETLDYVFDTGSGDLTITCSVPGERVTARPVPNFGALALGVGIGGILGLAGATMIIVWFVTRSRRQVPSRQ